MGANGTAPDKITFATLPLQDVGSTIKITYDVADEAGNRAEALVRTVTIRDTTPPVTTLLGGVEIWHEGATPFVDPWIVSNDTHDKDISAAVVTVITKSKTTLDLAKKNTTVGAVGVMAPAGTVYYLTYTSTDSSGNTGVVQHRTVEIVDTTPPVVVLKGATNLTWDAGVPYVEPGFTATDTLDGDLTKVVDVTVKNQDGDENLMVDTDDEVGVVLTVTYTSMDTAGNVDVKVRRIELVDTQPPELKMIGDKAMTQEVGELYVDPGVIASDLATGVVTDKVRVAVAKVGGGSAVCKVAMQQVATCVKTPRTAAGDVYTIDYIVTDTSGLTSKVTRTVALVDTKPPTLSVQGAPTYSIRPGDPFKLPECSCFKPGQDIQCTNDFAPASIATTSVVVVTFSCVDGTFTSTKSITIRVTPQSDADKKADADKKSGGGEPTGPKPKPEQIPVTIKIDKALVNPTTTAAPATTQPPTTVVATQLELQLAADATADSAGKLVTALGAAGAVIFPAATSPPGRDTSQLPVVKVLVQGGFKGDVEVIARSAMDGVVKVHTPVPIKHFEGGLVLPGTSASSESHRTASLCNACYRGLAAVCARLRRPRRVRAPQTEHAWVAWVFREQQKRVHATYVPDRCGRGMLPRGCLH